MNSRWPVFKINMPCPGFQSFEKTESGEYEYVDRVCHESRYRDFSVVHGDFAIELNICGHVLDSACGFSCTEEISDFLSDHYGEISHKHIGCDRKSVFAFKRGFCHEYVWAYSVYGSCDGCKRAVTSGDEPELLKPLRQFMRKHQGPYAARGVGAIAGKFCSASCAASHIGARCSTCGKCDENTLSDSFFNYSQKICKRFGAEYALLGKVFCSRQCCSLALDGYLRSEREERNRRKNLKCVQEVRKVLSKAKSALRNRDSQEVLSSLRKAFEQAASSP